MSPLQHYKILSLGFFLLATNSSSMAITLSPEEQLNKLKLTLPSVTAPLANYASCHITGNLIFVSGQLPMNNGILKFKGKVGETISAEEATEAAQLCALNILAQLKLTLTSLNRVKRCVKVTGFVNTTPNFTLHPQVINGASNLFASVFGTENKHARAAIGVSSLPLGAAVEIEAIFEIE